MSNVLSARMALSMRPLTRACLAAASTPAGSDIATGAASVLGYVILAGACIVRVPQVVKVKRAKNGAGLNPSTHEVEMFGYLVCVMNGLRRGLPVDVWGENLVHSSCAAIIMAMIYGYPPQATKLARKRKLAVWAAYATLCLSFATGWLHSQVVYRLYDVQNIAFICARVPQIYWNYKYKGTGQLHVVTRAALFLGNVIRIFTTIQKNGGPAMLFGHLTSLALNFTIFAQVVWYWNSKTSM